MIATAPLHAPRRRTEKVVRFPRLHESQAGVLTGAERFNVLACGRRYGKTTLGVERLREPIRRGQPVGWFTPTYKMLLEVWREVARRLSPIASKVNATERRIEVLGGGVVEFWSLSEPDVARGRRYGRAIIDEAAMVPDLIAAWNEVLRPTLADFAGDAWFLSTPKGRTDFHELFLRGQDGTRVEGWASWQRPTWENPHIPASEIEAMRAELPPRVFSQEVEAEFVADVEGALWQQATIDRHRVTGHPALSRIVIGVDPAGGGGDEIGIVAAGRGPDGHAYVMEDVSMRGSPAAWASRVVALYDELGADRIVAEKNYGGDMVEHTLRTARQHLPVTVITASRGKQQRAEPIAALYEKGSVHHAGHFGQLEMQMTGWDPDDRNAKSPDRLDALVWALSDLMLGQNPDYTSAFG
jgi:phage terminase large subunit-like protein